MDYFQQLNKIFSNDDLNNIMKIQMCSSTNSTDSTIANKGDAKKNTKATGIESTATKGFTATQKKTYTQQTKPTNKMSDWGDEEVITGKGFGTNTKSNNEFDQNEDDNENKRYNGGGGGGGRGGRGSRGGRGGGGRGGGRDGFNRYNDRKDNDDNGENGESNDHCYKNPIFKLTPKDFSPKTLKYFIENVTDLFKNANFLQKHTLMYYTLKTYDIILNKEFEETQTKPSKSTRTKQKDQMQITSNTSAAVNVITTHDQEIIMELPRSSSPTNRSNEIDLMQIFQQDLNKPNEINLISDKVDNTEFEIIDLQTPPPPSQLSSIINDLTMEDNLNYFEEDLQLSKLRRHLRQQEEMLQQKTLEITSKAPTSPRYRERQVLASATPNLQGSASAAEATPKTLRYNLRSSNRSASINYSFLNDTSSPQRPTPLPPLQNLRHRTYRTEQEYSLRFRLKRRTFLQISQLPRVKCNIKTSSYIPMDMDLIWQEYTADENLQTQRILQPPPTSRLQLLQPPSLYLTTTSLPTQQLLATTADDNISSLNAVRQGLSSTVDDYISSLSAVRQGGLSANDISNLNLIRPGGDVAAKDLSPIIEGADGVNNINNSLDSIIIEGDLNAAPQPQELNDSNIIEAIQPLETPLTTSSFFNTTANSDSGTFVTPATMNVVSTNLIPNYKRNIGTVAQVAPSPGDTGFFKTPFITTPAQFQEAIAFQHAFQEAIGKTDTIAKVSTSTPLITEPQQQKQSLINESTIEEAALLGTNVQNYVAPTPTSAPLVGCGANDDYRKDWYEILRARRQDINYKFPSTPKRKPKYFRKKPVARVVEQAIVVEQQPLSPSVMIEQILNSVLPPPTTMASPNILPLSPAQVLNISADFSNTIHQLPPESATAAISTEQQQYDQFIINNSQGLENVVENIENFRTSLDIYGPNEPTLLNDNDRLALGGQRQSSMGTTLTQPLRHFDIAILLQAPKKRLEIKRAILQNIIRQVSFDFTKIDCIKSRLDAAIGFAFVLELKGAGIIILSDDGRTIALR